MHKDNPYYGVTHNHPTRTARAKDLDETCVLVGECGGMSAVFGPPRPTGDGDDICITTEHGPLVLLPQSIVYVYDPDAGACDECGKEYRTYDNEHCGECGTCYEHCNTNHELTEEN